MTGQWIIKPVETQYVIQFKESDGVPVNISAVCHDINQDIAQHFRVSDQEAFDMSREQIMNDLCGPEDIATGDKHNSLYDAEVIRAIWKEIGNV